MKKILLWLVVVSLVAVFLLAGCKKTEPAETTAAAAAEEEVAEEEEAAAETTEAVKEDRPIKVGISVISYVNEFCVSIEKGARQAIEKLGGTCITQGADDNNERQMAAVEAFIQMKVDVIILQPRDAEALVPAVLAANKAGIPVITFDADTYGGVKASYVGVDNFNIGVTSATYMAKRLNGKGKVVMFHLPTHSGCLEREEGFNSVIKDYPDIQVVADHVSIFIPENMSAMETILQAQPKIDAVWCTFDLQAVGVTQAIMAVKRDKEMFVTGTDGDKIAIEMIKQGTPLVYTISQLPLKLGEAAGELAVKVAKGEEVSERVVTPIAEITSENADEFLQ